MPPRDMKWVEINDFRPGIMQRGVGQFSSQGLPLGSANVGTHSCVADTNGALTPLPKETAYYAPSPPDNWNNVLNNKYYISGFHVAGPVTGAAVGSGSQNEFHIAWEWYKTTAPNPHREYRWERHQIFANPVVVNTLVSHTGLVNPTLDAVRGTFFEDVRMDPTDPLNPGQPLVAAAWYEEGGAGDRFVSVFPTPAAPGTNAVLDISTALPCDIIAAHQGRLVMFEQRGWSHGSPGSWISNEQIWYTDINLPTIDNTVADTFATDRMTGIGAVKGVSANEILMVKFQGGAFTVSGDFSNPTVIRLPGVMPTYGATVVPVYTGIGLVYGVLGGGVYAWGGGSDSQCLSDQLLDGFWLISDLAEWINYHGKFELWRDMIVCPKSWLYDIKTGGWWRLNSTIQPEFFHYGVDYTGTLFAVPSEIDTVDETVVWSYGGTDKENSYTWVSNYIPGVGSPGRTITVREVVVEAVGVGSISVSPGSGGTPVFTGSPSAFPINGTAPQVVRRACSVECDGNLTLNVTSTGTGGVAAPTIFSIKVGYYDSTPVNPT